MKVKKFFFITILSIAILIGLYRLRNYQQVFDWATGQANFTATIQYGQEFHQPADFLYYYLAAKGSLKKINIYDLQASGDFAREIGLPHPEIISSVPYLCPPTFTWLILPLSLGSLESAVQFWIILSIMCLIAGLWITALVISGKNKTGQEHYKTNYFILLLLSVAVGINFFPVYDTLNQGQVNIILFFVLAMLLYAYQKDKKILAGFCIALSIAIKVMPALIGLFFLWKRDYRTVLAAFVFGIMILTMSIATLGWSPFSVYLNKVIPMTISEQHQGAFNASLGGFVHRIFKNSDFNQALINEPHYATWVTTFAIIILIIMTIWWTKDSFQTTGKGRFLLEFSLIICTMHLITTHSCWRHHLVLTLIPFLTAGYLLLRIPLRKSWIWFIFWLISYILVAFEFPALQDHCKSGLFVLFLSTQFWGLVLLWLLLAIIIKSNLVAFAYNPSVQSKKQMDCLELKNSSPGITGL